MADSEAFRQFEREHEEFTLRYLAAVRDFPGLDVGPACPIVGCISTTKIEREFRRRG